MGAPACGGTAMVSGAPSFFGTALGIIAAVAAGATAIGGVIDALPKIAAGVTAIGQFFLPALSAAGAGAFAAIILAAVTTAILIIAWAWQSFSALCGAPPLGKFECISGVINSVTAGFSAWYSEIAAFAGNQPRVDVVVKSIYWPVVTLNNPPMVWCAQCGNCPPSVSAAAAAAGGHPGCSPELSCYYHNNQVCSAAEGSAIGATVGAGIGAIAAIIAAVAAMTALGCTLAGPFVLACWLVLLIVLVVVIIAVAVAAAIGALIGSQAGKAAAGGSASPTSTPGVALAPGAYVTVVGNLVQAAPSLGANALWFAGWIPNANGRSVDDETLTNHNGTTVLGASIGTAPFCFTDPDFNIHASMDICPVP